MKVLWICLFAAISVMAQNNESTGLIGPRKATLSELERDSSGNPSFIKQGTKKSSTSNAIFDSLKDDTVFIRLSSNEFLTWKQLRQQAEIAIKSNKLNIPPGVTGDDVQEMMEVLLRNNVSKILRKYLRSAVFADEAKKLGLPPPAPSTFDEVRTNAIAVCQKRGAAGKRELELMNAPDSYFERNLTNVVWSQVYIDNIVKPDVEKTISKEMIERAIALRHEYNVSVPASNDAIRVQMEGIYQDVLTNKMSFAEAAEEYSDDANASEGGIFGTFERGEVRPELEAAFTNMVPGQLKGVVETPYSYHIIKLIAKHEEEGEEPSWEIAHIIIEKLQEKPEFTPETAKAFLMKRALVREVQRRQNKMILEKPIECVIPIQDKKRAKRRISSPTPQGKDR